MAWLRGLIAIVAVTALTGCDRLSRSPPDPGPAAAQAGPLVEGQPIAGLETYRGRSYSDFASQHSRFSAAGLGLSESDGARLGRAMAVSSGVLLQGGGAQALVFHGCAETGCADGTGVVAVDGATGASFAGVSDAAGKHVLETNDRLEALLRLNAPSRDWLDAGASQQPQPGAAMAARP